MERMRTAWLVVIIVLVLGLGVPKMILPARLAGQLRQELAEWLQSAQIQVELQVPWGWELVFGRIPGLSIIIEDALVDGLTVRSVALEGRQVRFAPAAFWRGGEFVFRGADSLQSTFMVSEQALQDFFWREVDLARNLRLELRDQKVSLRGSISLLDTDWEVLLDGGLQVWQDSQVRFVPQNLQVQELVVPPFLLGALNQQYSFTFDLGVFPFPIRISEVLVLEDQIMLRIEVAQ